MMISVLRTQVEDYFWDVITSCGIARNRNPAAGHNVILRNRKQAATRRQTCIILHRKGTAKACEHGKARNSLHRRIIGDNKVASQLRQSWKNVIKGGKRSRSDVVNGQIALQDRQKPQN